MITDVHIWEEMDYKFNDAEYRNAVEFHNLGYIYDALDYQERNVFNMTEDDYNKEYNSLYVFYLDVAEHARLNSSHKVWSDLDNKFMLAFRQNRFD